MDIHPHPKILLKLHRRRSEIELSPEYQRGVVWSKDKQQLLMDTILKKMHIPPVYFRVLENGYYECVDGQQRCTAIFDFFDNKFPLSKKYSPEFAGKYFKELPSNIRDLFDDYEIMVFEINNADDEEIRDMFGPCTNSNSVSLLLHGNYFFRIHIFFYTFLKINMNLVFKNFRNQTSDIMDHKFHKQFISLSFIFFRSKKLS